MIVDLIVGFVWSTLAFIAILALVYGIGRVARMLSKYD